MTKDDSPLQNNGTLTRAVESFVAHNNARMVKAFPVNNAIKQAVEALASHNNLARMAESFSANSAINQAAEALTRHNNMARLAEAFSANSAIKQTAEALTRHNNMARMAEAFSANSAINQAAEALVRHNNMARMVEAFSANNAIKQATEIALNHQSALDDALQNLTRPGHLSALIDSIDESFQQSSFASKTEFLEDSRAEEYFQNIASTNSLESFVKTLQELPDNFLQFLFFLFFLFCSWASSNLSDPLLYGFNYLREQQIPSLINSLIFSFVYDLLKGNFTKVNERVLLRQLKALTFNLPQSQLQHLRFITRSPLKIHLTPNSKSPVLLTIEYPQVVTLLSAQDAWAEILYEREDNDKVRGWVFIRYLSKF
ncbi:SH3 domain-containing protein [Alcaligenes aquatilis]|uniref:hypothetical protein n=1 Tax=Alcaligenes aquatilis TaxID=323284 RepID=UPI00360A09FD